ncbi:MAG TPA: site-specific tyrosine recombinase XerC [Opitutaceae bacterium]|nr:site-specific tyrosine recombinase XerC [Opitutaceae bacterium]
MPKRRGIAAARAMRHWSDRQGGYAATPDGFDRSDQATLASLVDQWLARLSVRAYSPRTVAARVWALRSFLAWAEPRALVRPAQIDKLALEGFQRFLWAYRKENGQPLAVVTQRGHLGVVQGFFAWLCRENLLPANPAADLELPRKQPRGLPRGLSLAEVEKILAVPDVSDPLGVRDRAILETLYGTGLRRLELVNLDVSDVDCARGLVLVRRGKGGKDRLAPLGAQALRWIERYLEVCRPLLEVSATESALFLSGYGGRLNPNYLGNWVRKTIDRAQLGKTGSCHLFRHACATHLLENGADLRMIQELLGHARLDTTQIYTAVSITQLRETHARCHPRGKALSDKEKSGPDTAFPKQI